MKILLTLPIIVNTESKTYSKADGPLWSALLATDDKELPRLLTAMLAPAGFSVQTVAARDCPKVDTREYVIVFYDGDLQKPVSGQNAAVVVISPTDAVAMYDAGADLVVERPFIANVLMAKVRSVLRRYGIRI